MFYVTQKSRNNSGHLFMVDRRRIQDRFWSPRKEDAVAFRNPEVAKRQMERLKFNDPKVVTEEEADVIAQTNHWVFDSND